MKKVFAVLLICSLFVLAACQAPADDRDKHPDGTDMMDSSDSTADATTSDSDVVADEVTSTVDDFDLDSLDSLDSDLDESALTLE